MMDHSRDKLVPFTPAGGPIGPAGTPGEVVPAGLSAGGPAGGGQRVTPARLLAGLNRQKWVAGGLGLLAGLPVAAAVWLLLPPPRPVVAATLWTLNSRQGVLFDHPDAVIDRQTQSALVRSKLVVSAALRNPEAAGTATVRTLPGDPVDWLSQAIKVDYPFGPEIVRLSLVVDDDVKGTEDAKKLVDAVRLSYLDQIVNKSATERKEQQDRLQTLQTQTQDALRRKQAAFRKLAERVGTGDPQNVAAQQRLIQEQIGTAQRELVKVQSDLRRQRLEELALKAAPTDPPAALEQAIEQYILNDTAVRAAADKRAKVAADMQAIEKVAAVPDRNPDYRRLAAEAGQLEQELTAAREKAKADYGTARERLHTDERKGRLTQLAQQIGFQAELEKLLSNELDRLNAANRTVNTANLDMEAERIDIKQAEDLYAKVSGALATLQAEQAAPVRVRPLESAGVVPANTDGRKARFAGAGFAGVFGLVCLLVALWELFQSRVDSPDAVGRACGLTVLGTVPRVPARRPAASGRPGDRWQAMVTESMACTQTMIRYGGRPDAPPRMLLVTSAGAAEGKTALATELAASFARGGAKTLLIDGDLRQPSAHTPFGLAAGPGLGELLRGDRLAEEVVVPVRPNLDLIPAGQCDDAALNALAAGTGAADLRRFLLQYAVVIIDSAPVLPVADAIHLARQADGVLIAVRAGHSRTTLVQEAARRLRHVGAPLLGLVVNGVSQRQYGYGYGYGTCVPTGAAT